MIDEWLRRTLVAEMAPGDEFVKPGFLQAYQTDRDGWASLRASAGTRFEVVSLVNGTLTARRGDGIVMSQNIPSRADLLKVVLRK